MNPAFYGSSAPAPPASPLINGPLRVDGYLLYDNAGLYRWKMVTAFDALRLFSVGESGQLDDYAGFTFDVGGNGWRVFLNWIVTGLDYRNIPLFFDYLAGFCDWTRSNDIRLEADAIQDSIPSNPIEQQKFINDCHDVLSEFDHVVFKLGNEPYKNGFHPLNFTIPKSSMLCALGSSMPDTMPYLPSAGFTTRHDPRDAEWFRKPGKNAFELRGITHDCIIPNEPIGAAEVYKAGSRSNKPEEFFCCGAASAMFTSGITGHGDSLTMQRCVIPGPIETECIRQLFRGVDAVPVEAPLWTYGRYGPAHPPTPMPVQVPAGETEATCRLHAMVGPTTAVTVNYHALFGWEPVGANGWTVAQKDGPLVICTR